MSERTITGLEPRIGDSVRSVEEFRVEGGKVAEFAAALGDDDPIYRDSEAAAERGYDRRPAPPTFTRTAMFPRYRPENARRLGLDIGFDIRYELHGEQVYQFRRPVYVGDTLSATTTLLDAYEREGRHGGVMTFAVLETEFVDEDGDPVVTERQTVIETDGSVGTDGPSGGRSEYDATTTQMTVRRTGSIDSSTTPDVGDTGPTTVIEGLTPQDFVRYAGASGDFNPIHYDGRYAEALGNPDVFGQGMLTAGYAGQFLADWFGLVNLHRFRARFTARVWPGDTLTIDGEVTGVGDETIDADVFVTRQTGDRVLSGDVTAATRDRS